MNVTISIDVTPKQIEQCIEHLKGRLRNAVVECQYRQERGEIAGLVADIKALSEIKTLRGGDAGVVKPVKPDPNAIKRQQEAEREHRVRETRRLGGNG